MCCVRYSGPEDKGGFVSFTPFVNPHGFVVIKFNRSRDAAKLAAFIRTLGGMPDQE